MLLTNLKIKTNHDHIYTHSVLLLISRFFFILTYLITKNYGLNLEMLRNAMQSKRQACTL